jgi:hypothetical protein
MAGFEVAIHGWFWVATEATRKILPASAEGIYLKTDSANKDRHYIFGALSSGDRH